MPKELPKKSSNMNEMKQLSDCMSPLSWAICAICVVPTLYFILHASFLEFLLMMVVDWTTFFLYTLVDGKLFQRLYPDVRIYFNGINDAEIQMLSLEEKVALLESFLKYPARRTIFAFVMSIIKILPALAVIVFVWHHSISNWQQFFLALGISLINFFFFSGGIFLESHIFLSNLIRQIHDHHDFSEAFSTLKISYSKKEFKVQEGLALFSVIFYILGLQWVVIETYPFTSTTELAVKILGVGLAGGILLLRLWYINQGFFIGGLEMLFESMGKVDYKKSWQDLPFHTSPLLAQFEKTFNLLSRRVRRSEQELSVLITQESEKSRFRAIGEMSALIAHDLASPMHFIQYSVEQLQLDPSPTRLQKYLSRLGENTTRAVQLLESMKARLKNTTQGSEITSFTQIHEHVRRLLASQFHEYEFKKIQFELDPKLDTFRIKISQVDLTHVLDNLYRNSVKNLLDNHIENPAIQLKVADASEHFIEIHICDNGTGLGHDRFEELTAYRYTQEESKQLHQGLGLRLTRRLIEYRGGQLEVLSTPERQGTTYRLRLMPSEEKPPVTISVSAQPQNA